jgi:hypothetical protein
MSEKVRHKFPTKLTDNELDKIGSVAKNLTFSNGNRRL